MRARLGPYDGAAPEGLEFAMVAADEPAAAVPGGGSGAQQQPPGRRYYWLDAAAPLREALRGTTLIEHPVVRVLLPGARAALLPRASCGAATARASPPPHPVGGDA